VNYILALFLALCVLFVVIQIIAFARKLPRIKKREVSVPDTPKDKARYYVGLAVSGSILKHIIVNYSDPRDDDAQYESYASSLSKRAVGEIRSLRGDNPFC